MKVVNVKTNNVVVFKPYSKTITVDVESKEDEFLLNKLNSLAENDDLILCNSTQEYLEDCGFSNKEGEAADELIKQFFINLNK